jgi:hypothetical protein
VFFLGFILNEVIQDIKRRSSNIFAKSYSFILGFVFIVKLDFRKQYTKNITEESFGGEKRFIK